jgi:hypothetical protein
MKNKLIAALVLSMLAPVVANAAPISWASESYEIWAQAEVDVEVTPQVDISANGSANVGLSIRNLSNSSVSAFELTSNVKTSYSGGTNPATQYAFAQSNTTLDNTFVATSSSLYVNYDYSSFINMASSAPSLSYQGLLVGIYLQDTSNSLLNQNLSLINNNYESNETSNAGTQYTLSDNRSYEFTGLTIGRTYRVVADMTPDIFTSGTIADNSSNSVLKVSFSDSPVTAVPEPETYVMLLTGLAFLGFSVRRKQQA